MAEHKPSENGIDYLKILDFVEKYGGEKYNLPQNAPEEKKKTMQFFKDNGPKIGAELKRIEGLIKRNFEFRVKDNSWQGGTFSARINDSIWIQLKYNSPQYISCPISISIFLERRKLSDCTIKRCRICLELDEKNAKDSNQGLAVEKEKYHKHVETAFKRKEHDGFELDFFTEDGNSKLQFESQDAQEIQKEIVKKIEEKAYEWVQIGRIIDVTAAITEQDKKEAINQYIENEILKTIKALIPYYEHVIGKDVIDMSKSQIDKNTILYGPPGTGKTYDTVRYAVAICEAEGDTVPNLMDVDKRDYINDIKKKYDNYTKGIDAGHPDGNPEKARIVFTTFHQSYGYEEFIEGIKPVLDGKNNPDGKSSEIQYTIEDGVFKKLCDEARKEENEDKNYVLIIDEINRGNISKIFGELITLIESTKREGEPEAASVTLPYSKVPFSVPKNVYIIGTMNTADRSIALMDTALRRRFHFVEMMPKTEVLRDIKVEADGQMLDVVKMLETINARIEYLYDREHTIGHAFFTSLKDKPTIAELASIFQKKIIPLLQEYFYEDYSKIMLVLGDNAKSKDDYKFIKKIEKDKDKIFRKKDLEDIPEHTSYEINDDSAFHNIQSYIEIIDKAPNPGKASGKQETTDPA